MWAIKKSMGITAKYFFVSDVRKFMREHPDFNSKQVSGSRSDVKKLLADVREYLSTSSNVGQRHELISRIDQVIV